MLAKKITDALTGSKITMFADGYVDEVWEIVDKRTGLKDYTTYSQMKQFTSRINNSGTGGVGLELVKKRRAFGGFTANIGFAAAKLGVDTAMVGVYGNEKLDPLFEPINEICNVYSMGDPAITHVFEFDDGKILMSYMEAVQDITWDSIVNKLGVEKIKQLISESDIIGVGYWSLLPAFDEIVLQISALLPQNYKATSSLSEGREIHSLRNGEGLGAEPPLNKKCRFFFDFADFLKKDSESLYKSLEILKTLNEKAPVILSLNEHEAAALFEKHNETMMGELELIPNKLENVRKSLGLDELVVHTPYYAVAASSTEKATLVECPFCEKPVRTAGAGDTFNGAYIMACLAKFDIKERLLIANSAVGFFLRNGQFPDITNVIENLKE